MDAPLPTSAPVVDNDKLQVLTPHVEPPVFDAQLTLPAAPDAPAADAPPADQPAVDSMPMAIESGPLEDVHGALASNLTPAPVVDQPAAPAVLERRSFGRPSADAPMVVTVH